MSQMVTLICPEGAFDYPIAHGEREFYPRRLNTAAEYPAREFGGPWVVDVPIEVYHHFVGRAGFAVMEQEQQEESAPVMKRLRKRDGSYAGCSHGDQSFEPNPDGVITVPHYAAGVLVESHGFEEVPDAPIDAALDHLEAGVAVEAERVEALTEAALAGVPEEQVAAARAEVEGKNAEQATQTDPAEQAKARSKAKKD